MSLDVEVRLGPGHIMLDGDPALPKRAQPPPIFSLCLLQPNGWMDQDATWYGGSSQPRRHCVRWGPSDHPLQKKGGIADMGQEPMSVVAKRLDGSRCHLIWRYASAQGTLC